MGLCIEDNLGFADNKFLWGIHQCIELTAINKEPCMLHKYLVNLSIFGIFRHKEHKHYLYNQDKFLQGRFLSIILQRRSQQSMKDNEFHQRKSSKESYREHRLMNHYNGFMGKNQCNYIQDHNKLKAKYKTNIQFNPCTFRRESHTFYTYRHWLSKDVKHYKIQEGISERKIYWYKNLIIHLVHKIKRSQSTS